MDKLVEQSTSSPITVKKTGVNLSAEISDIDLTQPMTMRPSRPSMRRSWSTR